MNEDFEPTVDETRDDIFEGYGEYDDLEDFEEDEPDWEDYNDYLLEQQELDDYEQFYGPTDDDMMNDF